MKTYSIQRTLIQIAKMPNIVSRYIGIVVPDISGGICSLGYVVKSPTQALCLIICSPKKTFFWAMRLVHPFIGGQKKYPGRLYTSG